MKSLLEFTKQIESVIAPLITPDIVDYNLEHPKSWSKYFINWRHHLARAYNRCITLGLADVQGKRILDISTGVGFFPVVCSDTNNMVCCTEDDLGYPDPLHLKMYKKIHKSLGLQCSYFHIDGQFCPIEGYFDVITSFSIRWNRKNGSNKTAWTTDEYESLFSILISHLTPDGKIYLYPLIGGNISTSELSPKLSNRIKILPCK